MLLSSSHGAYPGQYNRIRKHRVLSILPNGAFNLFSLPTMTDPGWLLGGSDKGIWLTKGTKRIDFDIQIPTPKGVLFAMYFKRDTEIVGAATDKQTKVNIEKAHDLLGPADEETT